MVITYYIRLFHKGDDRHKGILMSLLLLFAERKRAKTKKEDDTFLSKKAGGKTKQCYHNDICRWKGDSFSSEVEITMVVV